VRGGGVWPPTGRKICQRPLERTTGQTWICSNAHHTRTVVTQIRPITFTLVVDDFGVKYVGKQQAEHLKNALEETYTVSTDWTGGLYCGIALTWDYRKRSVKLSMPGYIEQALHKFQNPKPTRPQHLPYPYKEPTYGVNIQLTAPLDNSPPVEKKEITRIQQVLGTLLYWARAVSNIIIPVISSLASEQAKSTEAITNKLTQLINFCTTHPDTTIQYTTSDMVLHIHSDASYLSEPNARSPLGGYFFLSSKQNSDKHIHNGPILAIPAVYKNVFSSVMEAEVARTVVNAKEGVNVRNILNEMGHQKPQTPLLTKNITTFDIVSGKMKQQRSKAIEMHFYWLNDREAQEKFLMLWAPGKLNLADYYTKHHAPAHHRRIIGASSKCQKIVPTRQTKITDASPERN
jgi:hypothetical protein